MGLPILGQGPLQSYPGSPKDSQRMDAKENPVPIVNVSLSIHLIYVKIIQKRMDFFISISGTLGKKFGLPTKIKVSKQTLCIDFFYF